MGKAKSVTSCTCLNKDVPLKGKHSAKAGGPADLCGVSQHQLCAKRLQQHAPLQGHGRRHRQDQLVALGGCYERQPNACVPRGGLHKSRFPCGASQCEQTCTPALAAAHTLLPGAHLAVSGPSSPHPLSCSSQSCPSRSGKAPPARKLPYEGLAMCRGLDHRVRLKGRGLDSAGVPEQERREATHRL